MANGERITGKVGDVMFNYGEDKGASPVIFGEQEDVPLLGVVNLQALGLEGDPIKWKVKAIDPMAVINKLTKIKERETNGKINY